MGSYKKSAAGIYVVGDDGHNFASEDVGETDPTDWTNADSGGNCWSTVAEEIGGHTKILQLMDKDGGNYCRMYQSFAAKTDGFVQFYLRVTSDLVATRFCLYESGPATTQIARIIIDNDKWYYTSGGADNDFGPAVGKNTWYHIAVVFNHSGGAKDMGDGEANLANNEYRLFINGTKYGDWPLENNADVGCITINSSSGHTLYTSYWDAFGYSWDGTYSWDDNLTLASVISLSNSNVLKCEITQEIFNFPTAEVILDESETIGQGQLFQVTDNYSVDNQTSSDIIFEGQVIVKMNNYPFEMICESRASEAGNFNKPGIKCTGTHSGDSDDVLESIRSDLCDYIIKGLHDSGSAMGDRVYSGDKDIFAAWRNLALFEGKIWFYKTPIAGASIDIDFTSGDDDTGVSITQASNIWDFKAGRARQYFNQVNVQGEIESTMGTADDLPSQGLYGIIPYTHRDASLTTALAATAATNILAILDNDPLLVQFKYQDATIGFVQPGQYITLSYDLDGVTEVASQTFIVNKIVYNSVSGVGEIWASSEITYSYKMLNYASRQLPMENSELIQQNAGNVGTNTTDIADIVAALGIGIGNKRWVTCTHRGSDNPSRETIGATTFKDAGASDYRSSFHIPIPLVIGAYNLVATQIRFAIQDADANDYLDHFNLVGAEDEAAANTIEGDATNRTAAGIYTTDIADVTIGGVFESIHIYYDVVATTAGQFDISWVQLEYYYT